MGAGESLDFVTVTFSAELRMLQLQARSMALYLPGNLVGTINLIVNEGEPEAAMDAIRETVVPLYGLLKDKVRIWSRRDLAGDYDFIHSGWYSQQVMKLLISRHLTCAGYIILDTKNHFIRALTRGDFIAGDGRLRHRRRNLLGPARGWIPRWWPRWAPGGAPGEFPERFVGTFRYFGLDLKNHARDVVPKTTPFPVYSAFARGLIEAIEAREGIEFARWFEHYYYATEFYLLQAYPAFLGLKYRDYYEPSRSNVKVIYPDWPQVIETLETLMPQLDDPRFYCFGVHRASARVLRPEVRGMLTDFWRARGLMTPQDKTGYFFEQSAPELLHGPQTSGGEE